MAADAGGDLQHTRLKTRMRRESKRHDCLRAGVVPSGGDTRPNHAARRAPRRTVVSDRLLEPRWPLLTPATAAASR